MKKLLALVVLLAAILIVGCNNKREGTASVLVFSKTMGFKHASIPSGLAAIQKLGEENNFRVDTTKNAAAFTDLNLQQYSAIVFLSTTGNVLDHKQEAAFERYVQAGGGFVGIHAATDTEYDWNWYGRLVGAYFESHPAGTAEADFIIKDQDFIATQHFSDTVWHRTDELYNFKKINPDVNVLMTVDESTYEGGTNGDFHPMSWYHEYDGGRAFYTAAGHTDESFSEPEFLQHILGGIQYAIGDNLKLKYKKATTQIPPDMDRFSKVVLVGGNIFMEPTEMTILPNNEVLVAQRRGEIMHYNPRSGELKQVAQLDVYHKSLTNPDVNAEEGLMGLQKDPDYGSNNWVYAYYAPSGDTWVNRLSRFTFKEGVFDLSSEQVILDVESQREICCHTGGSIAFGPDGLLYLSTGDNSTPFDEPGEKYVNSGFAPLNDSPGHESYDARRSSGNTNDLRGKIIRIRVNDDGTYDIPKGNLFPPGTEGTRPEIYTMGHRNPYRISVDPKNRYVYWGDVGPDAQEDSLASRGPRGYDEVNQAREAGNFGWPLFVADNKPYVAFDYETGERGAPFDPEKPVNNSRNNTGLRELPRAMPAFVYYPYVSSMDFPQVGTGGRNAMAGPVYYSDLYSGKDLLPGYYDGKLIIYDWMRGWMKAVRFFPDGSYNKMEPFASEIDINSLIDMELGPDGRLYLLEYGSGWFTRNEDSGLSYIEYNGGNRPPVIDNFIVDRTSGPLPLKIVAEVAARDREKDAVSYVWKLGDDVLMETQEPKFTYTFEQGGEYPVSVEITDDKGAGIQSKTVTVVAGNTRPEVSIDIVEGNSSFMLPGVPVTYQVNVQDLDDEGPIKAENLYVSVEYRESFDAVNQSLGHQQLSAEVSGKSIAQALDCKTCHKEREASIGPTYLEIAQKYQDDPDATSYIQNKIVAGGSGVWGEVTMPAHPNISSEESRQIALYIQSLAGGRKQKESLPAKGSIYPDPKQGDKVLVLRASYTDNGQEGVAPLTGSSTITLKGSTVSFTPNTLIQGMTPFNFGGTDLLLVPPKESWFAFEDIDLTGVKVAYLMAGWQEPPQSGLHFEMRLGSPKGKLIGKGSMPKPVSGQQGGVIPVQVTDQLDVKVSELYFVYTPKEGEDRGSGPVAIMNVRFDNR